MVIGLIFARGSNGAFGLNGGLPWHVPEDLALFKRVTNGHAAIMGLGTWLSLPAQHRPLKGRINIIITRRGIQSRPAEGVYFVRTLKDAFFAASMCKVQKTWVIGGRRLITEASPYAEVALITNVKYNGAFDISAPTLERGRWGLVDYKQGSTKRGKADFGHHFELWKPHRILGGGVSYE